MDRSWGVTGTLTFMTPNSVTSRGTGHTKKEEALGNPRRFDTQYLPLYNTKDSTRGYCVAQASTDDDTHKNFFSDFYPPVYFVYSPYLKSHNSPFYWNFFSLDFTWLVCDTQLMRLAAISHACDDLPVSLYPIARSTIVIQNFFVPLLSLILAWIWLDEISNGLP